MVRQHFDDAVNSVRGETAVPTTQEVQPSAPATSQRSTIAEAAPSSTLSATKIGGAWFHPNNRSEPLPAEKWHSSWAGLKQYVTPKPMTGTPVYKKVGRVSVVPAPGANGSYIPKHLRGPEPSVGELHSTVDYDGTNRELSPTQTAENTANLESRKNWMAHHEVEAQHHLAMQQGAGGSRMPSAPVQSEPSIEDLEKFGKELTPRLKEMHGTLQGIHSVISPLIQHDRTVASLGSRVATNALNAAKQHASGLASSSTPEEAKPELQQKYDFAMRTANDLKTFSKDHLTKMGHLGSVPTHLTRGVKSLNAGEQVAGILELKDAANKMVGTLRHLTKPSTQQLFEAAGVKLPENLDFHLGTAKQIANSLKDIRTQYGESRIPSSQRGLVPVNEGVLRDVKPEDVGSKSRKNLGFRSGEGIVGTAPQAPRRSGKPVERVPASTIDVRNEGEKANQELAAKTQQEREAEVQKHMAIAHRAISNGGDVPFETRKVIGEQGLKAIINHIATQQLKKVRE